jgi:hypothetical protein
MQQVRQVMRHPTMTHPNQSAIMNKMKRMKAVGSSRTNCIMARAASMGEQRRAYINGGMK